MYIKVWKRVSGLYGMSLVKPVENCPTSVGISNCFHLNLMSQWVCKLRFMWVVCRIVAPKWKINCDICEFFNLQTWFFFLILIHRIAKTTNPFCNQIYAITLPKGMIRILLCASHFLWLLFFKIKWKFLVCEKLNVKIMSMLCINGTDK